MPVPIKETLGIFADNSRQRRSVLPLAGNKITGWARGVGIPSGGETILYTGQMYQLIPSINAMSRQLAKFENSWITNYFGIGRAANKIINLSQFMAHADPREQEVYDRSLRNIAGLLKAAGINFGYLYKNDLYSGALTYDEGLDDAFVSQAQLIYRILKAENIKQIITVDPHTTNILRSVYPEVIKGFDIRVNSYLEILSESRLMPLRESSLEVTIHDSCIYARHEDMVETPRRLLKQIGIRIQETELCGKLTHCCGGPLESLFPNKASEIAKKRIEQLSDCANQVVTLCPICLANLKRAAPPELEVRDISDYLIKAYPADTGKDSRYGSIKPHDRIENEKGEYDGTNQSR
jgi:hypothetical protein